MTCPEFNHYPIQRTFAWHDPLEVAAGIREDEDYWTLLYSGLANDFTGRYSYLALRPEQQIIAEDFTAFEQALSSSNDPWFGYLGYDLRRELESLPADSLSTINPPALWMIRYRLILLFDHQERRLNAYAKSEEDLVFIPSARPVAYVTPTVTSLGSSMSKAEYIRHVDTLLTAIYDGTLYQANLTRKFYGTLEHAQPFPLFTHLCKISPAPYSAFFKFNTLSVISSSPEQFLTLDQNGYITTRPIKGSAARHPDKVHDAAIREALISSPKNRAENLMIVDLMRNDLAKSGEPGSINTESLFDCTSYATIHHLSSTISGQLRTNLSPLDLIKGCFPPGSMTGTPKIKAMEYCAQLEKLQRGIYSGCLGWISPNQMDLSVVIRTLIIEQARFEFQVGGAIVADSIPEEEWRETLTKASAIAALLTIPIDRLEDL